MNENNNISLDGNPAKILAIKIPSENDDETLFRVIF